MRPGFEVISDKFITCPNVLDAVVSRPRPVHPRGSRVICGGLKVSVSIHIEVEVVGDIVELGVPDVEASYEGCKLLCFPLT